MQKQTKKVKNNSVLILSIIVLNILLSGCQLQHDNKQTPHHPLIDQIWSVTEKNYITIDQLNSNLASFDVILLGETHDNAQHHQLQARVIDALLEQKIYPIIAFEMLNQNQQESIQKFQNQKDQDTDNFAEIVNWEKTGWPEWSLYRPVFAAAIENNLTIIAANLNSKQIRKVIKQGAEVLSSEYQSLLKKYQYDATLKKQLKQDILSAHCDMLPEKMLDPMLLGQQTRDIAMTMAIQKGLTSTDDKVVLIAGSGHTRTDYGIPYYLHSENPAAKIVSIAFFEVSQDKFQAADYAEDWNEKTTQLPFDYVWFTLRTEREDQCEKMRAYMKKKARK